MKYYTKEWYALMQGMDYTIGYKKISDGIYSNEEIQAFYSKGVRRWVAEERKEYENRLPFDAEAAERSFEETYRNRLRFADQDLPDVVRDKVDRRILALGLLPESIYGQLKQMERENKKTFRAIEKRAEKDLGKQYALIPERILEIFQYHDANILQLEKKGRNIVMVLNKDGLLCKDDDEALYDRVIFEAAEFVEREKGLRIHCHREDGEIVSNCFYLYDELYRLADDGYEVHMLVTTSGLKYVTIRCRDIRCEANVAFTESDRESRKDRRT